MKTAPNPSFSKKPTVPDASQEYWEEVMKRISTAEKNGIFSAEIDRISEGSHLYLLNFNSMLPHTRISHSMIHSLKTAFPKVEFVYNGTGEKASRSGYRSWVRVLAISGDDIKIKSFLDVFDEDENYDGVKSTSEKISGSRFVSWLSHWEFTRNCPLFD